MEMHHKLRRDPSWDPRGCNICGTVGHQAADCPNGTVNWKQIYGDDAFVLRPPVYESQLRARRQFKVVDDAALAARASEYAKATATKAGLSWEEVEAAAEASQAVEIRPLTPEELAAAAAEAAARAAAIAAATARQQQAAAAAAAAAGMAAGGGLLPPAAAAAAAAGPPLLPGWAVAYDPQGKPYYYHKETRRTQWHRPV